MNISGKIIALGYSSGAIRLYNVDKLEMIHELFLQPIDPQQSFDSITPSAINFLIWVQENESNSENVNEQQVVIKFIWKNKLFFTSNLFVQLLMNLGYHRLVILVHILYRDIYLNLIQFHALS